MSHFSLDVLHSLMRSLGLLAILALHTALLAGQQPITRQQAIDAAVSPCDCPITAR